MTHSTSSTSNERKAQEKNHEFTMKGQVTYYRLTLNLFITF